METERTLRELLIVLKDNKQHYETGLCLLITYLVNNKIITKEEAQILWEPREKWLDKWINKLETDNLK